jgi:hypothetical protein
MRTAERDYRPSLRRENPILRASNKVVIKMILFGSAKISKEVVV